jgi:hypothetical protein
VAGRVGRRRADIDNVAPLGHCPQGRRCGPGLGR